MSISQICQDASLYGHALTSLPQKLWSFSQNELCLREHLDSLPVVDRNNIDSYRNDQKRGDYLFVERNFIVVRDIEYRKGTLTVADIELVIWNPLIDLTEFVGRRILGSFATAVSLFTLLPIGFIAKIIHHGVHNATTYIGKPYLVELISMVWNDQYLYGDALTSAPSKWYQHTTAPLSWHLRPDGTDKRYHSFSVGPKGYYCLRQEINLLGPFASVQLRVNQPGSFYIPAEYSSFSPIKFFEVVYKGFVGVPATLLTGLVSPLGFIAKMIHVAKRRMASIGHITAKKAWKWPIEK